MKNLCALFLCLVLALTGCYTSPQKHTKTIKIKDRPETVLVTYHVKPGQEKQFEALLARAWQAYRDENLVHSQPHVLVRAVEENNTVGYVEVFTWVSHAAPQDVSDSIKTIWAQEQSMCEARGGRIGVGGGEVDLLAPGK